MSYSVTIIGAGNLATHLAKALFNNGFQISQIYSRTIESAQKLAGRVDAEFTIVPEEINTDTDICFVALKDSVVESVLEKVNFKGRLLVHCSGSLPIDILKKYSANRGVFYPLQTFSKNREIDFNSIPVFVEADSEKNKKILTEVARQLTGTVYITDSEQRKKLHIAAVFACNFVNHLYTISSEIISSAGLPFDVLKPLIAETAEKIKSIEPARAQTGPAVRFDENIISSHLKELEGIKNFDEIYKLISQSIFNNHKTTE